MRKRYGFTSAIIFTHPIAISSGAPACGHRLRVKEWAYKQLGKPAAIVYGDIVNYDSDWFAGVTDVDEYTIAFKDERYRNLALLM